MKSEHKISFGFHLMICALEILDSYQLSLKNISKKIPRDHSIIKEKFRYSLISNKNPQQNYKIDLSNRELSYLRKITFQYFIALLRQGIIDDKHNYYHIFYKYLNARLGKNEDDIDEIKDLLL